MSALIYSHARAKVVHRDGSHTKIPRPLGVVKAAIANHTGNAHGGKLVETCPGCQDLKSELEAAQQ